MRVSVAPVHSLFGADFIAPQSYFLSNISVLMKLSSESGPSLRANWFPHRYDFWLYRTFTKDREGFPVQISLLGQLSL